MKSLSFAHQGIAVFQHTVLAYRFSHVVITLFDEYELMFWLRLIL